MSKTSMEIRFTGGMRANAHYGDFEIPTDQSVKNGGQASAPEPFDLFLASLGTCAGAYIAAFCEERDIPTERIRLIQSWSRDEKRKLTGIRLEIQVPSGFPEKYHQALLRAAGRCSVKRVLEGPPTIETELRVAD
jgi:ribosomal protein S12 methylthiotransferase accessory factor